MIQRCLQQGAVVMIALLLAACSSESLRPAAPSTSAAGAAAANPAGRPAPSMPKAGSGRGGYYKDDGPGDNPPPGLELTLDAEPKVEPYSLTGNKPYVVFGKTYTPMIDNQPFSQRGTGSWYGKKFHGQRTSSGEPYDMYKMTAAHPTLPIPSYARITNLSNGKQVIVKINDRGPFHTSRIVDLSYTAALKLDYLGKGSSELLLERLLPADIEKMAENKKNGSSSSTAATNASDSNVPVVAATAVIETLPISVGPPLIETPLSSPDNAGLDNLVARSNVVAEARVAVPPVIHIPNAASGIYLQFGAFGLRSNAEATFSLLQNKLAQLPGFEIVQQGTLYRLFSGPFSSREDANHAIQSALQIGLPKPLIVQR